MSLAVYDRVKETTTTTGTGTYSLGGAPAGFRAASSVFSTGDTSYWCVENGTDWEVFLGTLTSGAPWTLARTAILASSNAGAAVNWGAGSKNVFCTQAAGKAVFKDASNVTNLGVLSLTGVAGTSALTITDATQTTSKPVLDLSQTVNAAGVTFEVFGKKTLTDTASATESRFEAWYVGSALKTSIRKDGAIHLWNLATDASNYERGFIHWASNVLEIGTEKAGTGTNRAVKIVTQGGAVAEATFNGGTTIHAGLTCQSFATFSNYVLSSVGYYNRSNTGFINFGTADDITLVREAAGTLALRNSTNAQEFRTYGTYTSATQYHYCAIKTAKTTLTATAGATITATNLIPDGAFLIGVTTRVNTTCTTATGYTVGDGTDADLWGVASAVAAGTATSSADFTAAGACGLYTAAQSVVITATGGNFDGTGAIEVVAHYLTTMAD